MWMRWEGTPPVAAGTRGGSHPHAHADLATSSSSCSLRTSSCMSHTISSFDLVRACSAASLCCFSSACTDASAASRWLIAVWRLPTAMRQRADDGGACANRGRRHTAKHGAATLAPAVWGAVPRAGSVNSHGLKCVGVLFHRNAQRSARTDNSERALGQRRGGDNRMRVSYAKVWVDSPVQHRPLPGAAALHPLKRT